MIPQGWTIGRLAGVEIKINTSLLLIAFFVAYVLANGIFPLVVPNAPVLLYWLLGGFFSTLFIGSVLWHEMAHVVTAQRYGLPVVQVVLHLFGGVAQIARDPERPAHEFWIAIAGPLSSVVLAVTFGALSTLDGLVGAGCAWLAQVNLTLAVFNLLPGFPLDGGRVLRSILWRLSGSYRMATRQASRVGQVVAAIFVLFALWMIFRGLWFNGLWFILIAAFLYSAASASYRMAVGASLPMQTTVRQIMRYNVPLIEPTMPLALLAWRYLDHARDQAFPVVQQGQLVGLITSAETDKYPRLEWGRVHVDQVMIPLARLATVSPDDTIATALRAFDRTDTNHAPVVYQGQIVGMLNRRDIVYRT
ncbi:MAG: site-2 protease family protein [Anaerolineae bacterium]|nr:site-2 protease family protein [Anaerolineae bacterium]